MRHDGVVLGPLAQYRDMAAGVLLGLAVAGGALALNPVTWPLVVPIALLWVASPLLAFHVSRSRPPPEMALMSDADRQGLRLVARRTWRFFETHVTAANNDLPPDNFQETPEPVVAHRTSPTNIGLYLLATTAAHDLGWIGRAEATARLERTLATMHRMPTFRGHLYNWHATDDLRVLDPAYVSSVDSGNLAGHLIAVAQACAEWQRTPLSEADWRAGLSDTLLLAERALNDDPTNDDVLTEQLVEFADAATGQAPLDRLLDLSAAALDHLHGSNAARSEVGLLGRGAARLSHKPRRRPRSRPWSAPCGRLNAWPAIFRDRHGVRVPARRGQEAPFDRLLGFHQPARPQLLRPAGVRGAAGKPVSRSPRATSRTRHWFRLGRAARPDGRGGSVLISWSGSMFEYLMPSLVMRAPEGSLLAETNRRIVDSQQAHGTALGIPWGISESAFNARDLEMTYQYSNFGVPSLGLKRGLSENRVVAP